MYIAKSFQLPIKFGVTCSISHCVDPSGSLFEGETRILSQWTGGLKDKERRIINDGDHEMSPSRAQEMTELGWSGVAS
ncbi:unnamed protein product [Leptosia nina]|uniref:Uncharacterized protein n=1 Tax=Leptosia nina TaxID=320188 RepID=A0AAV1K0B4_9NEOP